MVGIAVMIGWLLNITLLKSILPHFTAMRFNTALSFTLAGMALLTHRRYPRLTQILAVLLTLLALLTLSQYIFGWNLGIDQFFVQDLQTAQADAPGRMSPPTASNFILLGIALFLINSRHAKLVQALVVIIAFIGLLAVTGYLYGVESFYRIANLTSVALHTGITFVIISLGILAAQSDRGFMRIVTSKSAGGTLLRLMTPAIIMIPILVGWLLLQGEKAGLYDALFELALFALSNVVIFSILIGRLAQILHSVDTERESVLMALKQSRDELEQRVQERTADLTMANAQLQTEIAERQRTEQEIRRKEQLLRLLLDNLPEYIYVKDTEGRFLIANEAVIKKLGVKSEQDVLGKTDFDFYEPTTLEVFRTVEAELLKTDLPQMNIEGYIYDHHRSANRWVSANKIPLHNEHGGIIGLVCISHDLTERKQAEEQRLQLQLEREKVQMFNRFIGDASHDLRTPISILMTSLDLLKKITSPEGQARHIAKLEMATNHIRRLIDNLFTLLRLDMVEEKFQLVPAQVNQIVEIVYDKQRPGAASRQQQILLRLETNLPQLMLDVPQLIAGLQHVVENAIHFTPEGGQIIINTCAETDYVLIEVCDTGIGIKPEEIPLIFERFYRADKARSISTGSSGLGLTIAQKIVKMHGGQIEVESTIGVGSTFRIRLPITPPDKSILTPF